MNLQRLLSVAERRGYFRWMPTKMFLQYKYRRIMGGGKLDLDHPVTFTEKLQKLKIMHADSPELPLYTKMADKILAKELVAECIGSQYIIPTLGKWETFDEIPFEQLPERFVLKTNHDSGGVAICTDKAIFDVQKAKAKLKKSLKRNFYWYGREPQYRDIHPMVFAEAYLEDHGALADYKFFCFHGEPRVIMTVHGGHQDESRIVRRMYDTDWNLLPVGLHGKAPVSQAEPCPPELEEMLEIARKLSAGLPHIRVDLYLVQGKIYFGELTFCHQSGYEKFDPVSFDEELGSYLNTERNA